jgi:hypothetical protein
LRFLILPAADTECFQIFLDTLGRRFSRQYILLILDGAPNHTTDDLLIPADVMLELLPPCSPELNPQENIWDENPRENLQKLCSQVDGQGLRSARRGGTLHRTQPKDGQIHHILSIYRPFNVMCKWYNVACLGELKLTSISRTRLTSSNKVGQ